MKDKTPVILVVILIIFAATIQYFQPQMSGQTTYGGVGEIAKGTTITTVVGPGQASEFFRWPSIAIGANGYPIIVYTDQQISTLNHIITVLSCGNNECTQGNVINTLSTQYEGQYPHIVVGSDGIPLISFYLFKSGTPSALVFARCGDPTCSSGNSVSIIDSIGYPVVGADNSIAIGSDGLPVFAYSVRYGSTYGPLSYELRVAKCSDNLCSGFIQISILDGDSFSNSYVLGTEIAIGSDGFPRVAYKYSPPNMPGSNSIKLAVCKNLACTVGYFYLNTIEQQSLGGFTGFPELVIGQDGFPVISYSGFGITSQSYLRIAKCSDSTCTNQPITISLPDNFVYSSDVPIVMRGNGLPQVAYVQSSSKYGDLRLLSCKSPDCQSSNKAIIEGGASPNVGGEIDLAIGKDGNPVIVYTNWNPTLLKVAKCHTPTCLRQ